jgi:hypothetical protein
VLEALSLSKSLRLSDDENEIARKQMLYEIPIFVKTVRQLIETLLECLHAFLITEVA